MIKAEISIWIASKEKWAHLIKRIKLDVIPRVGEFIVFKCKAYDYIPWKITQITHRETGKIEIWTELLDNINDRNYSFEEENEFIQFYDAFIEDGWICERGVIKNTRIK